MKEKLIQHCGGKCIRCGYNKLNAALTFHHRNPEDKEFTIGGRNYSWERMKKEAEKCDLVCHNCHAEIHYENKAE